MKMVFFYMQVHGVPQSVGCANVIVQRSCHVPSGDSYRCCHDVPHNNLYRSVLSPLPSIGNDATLNTEQSWYVMA